MARVEAAGFVLAGGQSTRMGQNKALLPFGGETLAELALRKLRAVCAEVSLAGGVPELARFGRLIPDGEPGCGPLGGIVAALTESTSEWNLFLPVDVPLFPVAGLESLLEAAGGSEYAVLAQFGQLVHPLCGVYARRALPMLQEALGARRLRVRAAIEAAGPVVYWQVPDEDWLRNVNTPEDFQTLA